MTTNSAGTLKREDEGEEGEDAEDDRWAARYDKAWVPFERLRSSGR